MAAGREDETRGGAHAPGRDRARAVEPHGCASGGLSPEPTVAASDPSGAEPADDPAGGPPERSLDDPTEKPRPTLFVGLGASAGGLEALRQFFDGMSPSSGVAFIVVQHLSPDHKSLMDELLAKNTEMSVESVVDGVEVRPDSVYLIPPRKNMLLSEGRLHLSDQQSGESVNLPIDFFFRSLAESARRRAVAIVLSGTGSDGSRGIRAVKEAGGLVLAQEPDTAKFDGMPWSAVHTGLVDVVLDPGQLAEYLESYVRHPIVADEESSIRERLESDEETLRRIFVLLRKRSGIEFAYYKPATVARRIERRMGVHQLGELGEYLELLEKTDGEVETLARELLINVTRFFRDGEAFDYLERRVIRRLFEEDGDAEVRVWIAGCSSGEEAYSIAILLDEARRDTSPGRRIKIFATDVDPDAVAEASQATYSLDIEGDVSAERLSRYFIKGSDGYTVRQEIRQLVVFANHNMISDPPFSNIDLICCRNVLIYFRHAVQQKIIAAFHFSLKRDGIVFFGSSETVGELKSHFEPLDERLRVFRKSSSARLPSVSARTGGNLSSLSRVGSVTLPPMTNLLRSSRSTSRELPFDHVKDSLINDFVPACLILDSEQCAVHVYGDANRFLTRFPAGRVSTYVQDIIAEELAVPVGTALSRARSEGQPVYYSSISATIGGRVLEVDLQVEHFPEKNGRVSYSVLVLSESGASESEGRARQRFDIDEETRQRIRDLESELRHKQEHLQVTNEELETTNEELQSANEELMSSNEELQSANEELQSVNEELFTVNSEYQEKIAELSIANADLDNVLSFTSVGIVFLDRGTCIRKYTEVATRFFNLLPTDIGRPLHHISDELEYPRLFEDIDTVVATGEALDRDVFTNEGEIIQIKLIPYSPSVSSDGDEHLQGTILTLTDLTRRVRQDRERRERIGLENAAVPPPGNDEARYRVLVIDDSESDRVMMKRQLSKVENIAIEIVEAIDIESGMAALESERIDICLVDYRLGPDTANDFAERARRDDHVVPVIMVSGYTREELREELPSSSLTHFINKEEVSPLLLELTLRNAVETALEFRPRDPAETSAKGDRTTGGGG